MTLLSEMRRLLPPSDILWSHAFVFTVSGECRLVAYLLECPVFEAFERNGSISVRMCQSSFIAPWKGQEFWTMELRHCLGPQEAAGLFIRLMDINR